MEREYFSANENLEEIIKRVLCDKKINNITHIKTGWTNIVYDVNTDDGNYIFRFPKDEFWSRAIVKDCQFAKFIHGKTSFQTADLINLSDKGRNFSVHKKIEGMALAEKVNELSEKEIKQISREIALFMYQLHNIKFNKDEVFTVDNIDVKFIDFLNELIHILFSKEDQEFWKYNEFSKKECSCLVHGDFNQSNIIIDENNHISAIIDFGAGGFGNKYYDIGRIIGRLPSCFEEEIIKNYEEFSNEKLNREKLKEEEDMWSNMDKGYINYMKSVGYIK